MTRGRAALLAAWMAVGPGAAHAAAPALCAVVSAPTLVEVGQVFTVTMVVHDCGDTPLIRVNPSLSFTMTGTCLLINSVAQAASGGGSVLAVAGPTGGTVMCPVALAAGAGASAYADFTWSFKGVAVGAVDLTITAAGLEVGGSPGATVFASDTVTINVQRPAAMSATLTVNPPGLIPYGATVTVYLEVMDNGDASVDQAFVYSVTVTGTAALTPLPCPPLASLCKDDPAYAKSDLASGLPGRTWTWLYRTSAPGTVTLRANVGGLDHLTRALVVSSPATTLFTVPVPSILSWTLTGLPVLVQGQEALFKVRATNAGTTQVCVTGLILALNGLPAGFSAQVPVSADLADSLLPVCTPPWGAGQNREFTVRATLAATAASGPALVSVTWTGADSWTGIPVLGAGVPLGVVISPAERVVTGIIPNPWSPADGPVRIGFAVPVEGGGGALPARVEVLTILGEVIRVLVSDVRPAGAYEATWNGKNTAGQKTASGIVLVRIQAGTRREVRKLAVLR